MKMKLSQLVGAGLLAFALVAPVKAQTHDDPVLDLMVRKGLVTQTEADQARAEEKQEAENMPANAGLIQLQDKSVQKLVFYGDGRLRFENIDQKNHYAANTLYDRERYRLRFGADYYYSDHFKAGFELESGTLDDSANQTFGATFTKSSINVGKIYLQWQPIDPLTLVAGKFSNPWYTTTDMVYSYDENPEGGAELLSFTIPLSSGSGVYRTPDPKDVKDAKEVAEVETDPGSSLTIGLNAVQFIYVDSNEGTVAPNINNNDVFIIGNQIPVDWKINKELEFKIAPGFTFYTGGGNTNYDAGVATNTAGAYTGVAGSSGVPAGTYFGTANSAVDPVFISPREADDLAIISAPGEFDFNVAGIPFRPYWDFEWNTEAHSRVQNVYLQNSAFATGFGTGVSAAAADQNTKLSDGIAWAAGLQVGKNKKKGDLSGLIEFRQIGLGAVDQNINGTDYADSYANQQGFKVAGAYNFTDFFTGTITYYNTWDYKSNLYSALGGTGNTPSATTSSTLNLVGAHEVQRVQVDLGWKF
jgi:hypothetical protein